jgi:hypothetical protein
MVDKATEGLFEIMNDQEIQEKLQNLDKYPALKAIIKQWHQLDDDQKHEVANLVSQKILSNQAKALQYSEDETST